MVISSYGGWIQRELPKEYILAFFLGNNRKQREKVMAVSKKMNLPIVTLPFQDQITFFDFLFGDIKLRNLMPQQLLYCIKNAKFVFTDSFHITVFSLIFHREVFVFKNFQIETRTIKTLEFTNYYRLRDVRIGLLNMICW